MLALLRASLVASAFFALGCNFILNPDGDGVLRCDNADDCDEPLADALADGRGQSQCAGAGGAGGGFTQSQDNKVCSIVDFDDVSCDFAENSANEGKAYYDTFNEAVGQSGVYTTCPLEKEGTLGCEAAGSTCTEGQAVTLQVIADEEGRTQEERTFCSPGNADRPAIEPSLSLKGQDVLDQHCRSYFCDESFVCNRASRRCVRCDPERAFGVGGCGELYMNGKPSTVYAESTCPDTANEDATNFGPVVQAPDMP